MNKKIQKSASLKSEYPQTFLGDQKKEFSKAFSGLKMLRRLFAKGTNDDAI